MDAPGRSRAATTRSSSGASSSSAAAMCCRRTTGSLSRSSSVTHAKRRLSRPAHWASASVLPYPAGATTVATAADVGTRSRLTSALRETVPGRRAGIWIFDSRKSKERRRGASSSRGAAADLRGRALTAGTPMRRPLRNVRGGTFHASIRLRRPGANGATTTIDSPPHTCLRSCAHLQRGGAHTTTPCSMSVFCRHVLTRRGGGSRRAALHGQFQPRTGDRPRGSSRLPVCCRDWVVQPSDFARARHRRAQGPLHSDLRGRRRLHLVAASSEPDRPADRRSGLPLRPGVADCRGRSAAIHDRTDRRRGGGGLLRVPPPQLPARAPRHAARATLRGGRSRRHRGRLGRHAPARGHAASRGTGDGLCVRVPRQRVPGRRDLGDRNVGARPRGEPRHNSDRGRPDRPPRAQGGVRDPGPPARRGAAAVRVHSLRGELRDLQPGRPAQRRAAERRPSRPRRGRRVRRAPRPPLRAAARAPLRRRQPVAHHGACRARKRHTPADAGVPRGARSATSRSSSSSGARSATATST